MLKNNGGKNCMHNRGGSGQPGLFLFYTQGTRKKSRQFTDLPANLRQQYLINGS